MKNQECPKCLRLHGVDSKVIGRFTVPPTGYTVPGIDVVFPTREDAEEALCRSRAGR